MLRKLKISRFKSIKNQTIKFGAVNLFIGGNGTGKSNILEAIGLVSACLGRGLGDSDIGSKGLRITPPELMKSSFKNENLPTRLKLDAYFSDNITYTAELQSRDNDPLLRFYSESASIGDTEIFGRSQKGVRVMEALSIAKLDKHRGVWDYIPAFSVLPEEAVNVFSEFCRYVIFSPQSDFLRARKSGRVDVPPVGLHGEGLSGAVASFLTALNSLRKAEQKKTGGGGLEWQIIKECSNLTWLPGWAREYGTHRGQPQLTSRDVADSSSDTVYFVDKFMHESRNKLSVYDSSEGTLFLLFAAIILSHADSPKIFALDNVDNALNPQLTRKLLEQIIQVVRLTSEGESRCGAKQVFLTSHNPTALDAFDLFEKDQRIFVVKRHNNGHTIVKRLKPNKGLTKEEWEIATKGRNLSQFWLDGGIRGALGELGELDESL